MRLLDKKFIELDVEQSSRDSLLEYMGGKLLAENIVKETYPQAIVEREKEFPTGILCRNISIAIPHTTGEHVNEPKIAVSVQGNSREVDRHRARDRRPVPVVLSGRGSG